MYATSKLIIPAKIAQDSPYVPKIRICLRPSPLLDKDNTMGSSLGSVEPFGDTPESEDAQRDIGFITQDADTLTQLNQETPKSTRKCRVSIDFENHDSLFTKVNLKKLINLETFEVLPLKSRQYLAGLLPFYDRISPNDIMDRPVESQCRLHTTALKNEFLSKALEDYSSRPVKGFNSRTGLRKSVGNRQRYSNPNTSPFSSSLSIMHTTPPPHPAPNQAPLNTKDDKFDQNSITSTPTRINGTLNTVAVSMNQQISRLRTRSTAPMPQPTYASFPLSSPTSQHLKPDKITAESSRPDTSLTRKRKRLSSSAAPLLPLFSQSTSSSDVAAAQPLPGISRPSSASASSSSPSPPCPPPSSSPSSVHSPNTSAVINSPPPKRCATSDSTSRRTNMPRLESTLLLQNGLKFPNESLKPPSVRLSAGAVPTRRVSKTNSDFAHPPHHHPLVVDSLSPVSSQTNSTNVNVGCGGSGAGTLPPTVMPPPRETKTLASVRERLRAKRLMLGQTPSSQCSPPAPSPQHPPPSVAPQITRSSPKLAPSLPNGGSLTPNPGASASGNIYSCPRRGSSSSSLSDHSRHHHHGGPPRSAPMFLNSSTLNTDVAFVGGSVSAPPTPQHSAFSQLPAILANLKQARVVVAPTRSISDSPVSSGESGGGGVVVEPTVAREALPVTHTTTTGIVPETAPTNGGVPPAAGTTTRAFFVDGNNLKETLALLQSLNPQATVTEEQYFLIPSTDKSHAILCRTPVPIQPKQQHQQRVPTPSPPVTEQQYTRRASASGNFASAASTHALPVILPAPRAPSEPSIAASIPVGMYREILPNLGPPRIAAASQPPQQTFFTGQSNLNNNHQQQLSETPNATLTTTTFLPPPPPPRAS